MHQASGVDLQFCPSALQSYSWAVWTTGAGWAVFYFDPIPYLLRMKIIIVFKITEVLIHVD